MKSVPLAAIDIGTNTFRLLIAEIRHDPQGGSPEIVEIFSDRTITRLGEGIADHRLISNAAIERSIAALKRFADIIADHNVSSISAIATSALRDAGNRDAFLKQALEETGLNIKIVSGEEEARITSSGMLIGLDVPETALMADIGGGSTELIFTKQGKTFLVKSLNLGVVHLADKYMKEDPPLKDNLNRMDSEILQKITPAVDPFKGLFSNDTVFIGTAGTVTSLAAMKLNLDRYDHDRIHNSRLSIDDVRNIYNDISAITARERAKYHSLEPGRLDIIVPGTLILLKLIETFYFKEVIVRDYGLREGIILELFNKTNK